MRFPITMFRYKFSMVLFSLIVITCSGEPRSTKTELTVKKVMPPEVIFKSLRRKLKGVDWKAFVENKQLVVKDEYIGYQLGSQFVHWSIAILSRQEKIANSLASNLMTLATTIDIDDDSILISIQQKIDAINGLMEQKEDRAAYRKIKREIEDIKSLIADYFKTKANSTALRQMVIAGWIEFMHFCIKGLTEQYVSEATTILNRPQEVDYFIEYISTDAKLQEANLLFNELKTKMNQAEKTVFSKTELAWMFEKLSIFREKHY